MILPVIVDLNVYWGRPDDLKWRKLFSSWAVITAVQAAQALGGGDDGVFARARRPARAASPFRWWRSSSCRARAGSAARGCSAATRTSQFGSCRVGTRLRRRAHAAPSAPWRCRSIDMKSPATARKRSPLAAGWVMARSAGRRRRARRRRRNRVAGSRAWRRPSGAAPAGSRSNSRARAPGRTRPPD